MKRLLRAPAAALLLAAAVGVSVPAVTLAAERDQLTARVKVSDLNLGSAEGQRKLERRTSTAIDKVCPTRGSAAGPRASSRTAYRFCVHVARNSVKKLVDYLRGRTSARS
ncbi:MAG: UrcA family protein [Steroidobacteraceae bacterium]